MNKIVVLIQVLCVILSTRAQDRSMDAVITWPFYLSPAPIRNAPYLPTDLLPGRSFNRRDDYTFVAGIGSYKLHTRAEPWNEARMTCEEEGGYLAILNSVAEANAVSEIFKNAEPITGSPHPDVAHIGFHDLYREGQFITIHGQSLAKAGFTRFSGGQPDNHHGNENCGSVYKNGGLNDIDCKDKLGFVCELPIH